MLCPSSRYWRHNAEQITTAHFVKCGFTCYFGWIDGKCLIIFLLMKINQFDIKTLIKDCFGLVILRSSKFLKPFLNMISERLYHECTVFWNSQHLYMCDVMLVIMSASNQRTAGARGRDFLDYFEGKQSMLSNQKPASYECETFEGFSFINLQAGWALGWVNYDTTLLHCLWNTDFMAWNLQNKADIWSLKRPHFLSKAVYQGLWIFNRQYHLRN